MKTASTSNVQHKKKQKAKEEMRSSKNNFLLFVISAIQLADADSNTASSCGHGLNSSFTVFNVTQYAAQSIWERSVNLRLQLV